MEAYMLPSEYEKYLKGDGDVHDVIIYILLIKFLYLISCL